MFSFKPNISRNQYQVMTTAFITFFLKTQIQHNHVMWYATSVLFNYKYYWDHLKKQTLLLTLVTNWSHFHKVAINGPIGFDLVFFFHCSVACYIPLGANFSEVKLYLIQSNWQVSSLHFPSSLPNTLLPHKDKFPLFIITSSPYHQ